MKKSIGYLLAIVALVSLTAVKETNAETIKQVWDEVNRKDFAFRDEIIMAIIEEHPMIKVLET